MVVRTPPFFLLSGGSGRGGSAVHYVSGGAGRSLATVGGGQRTGVWHNGVTSATIEFSIALLPVMNTITHEYLTIFSYD
jgi:hypothetical protein